MSTAPKRHHWWPECHSRLWTDDEGCITVIDGNGRTRRTRPVNTAVIGHYNSIRLPDGGHDSALEIFLANEVEDKAAPVLARLSTERRRDHAMEARFDTAFLRANWKGIRSDGFVPDERAFSARLDRNDRAALSRYIASLIVRVPSYKDALNSKTILENVKTLLGIDGDEAIFQTDVLHVDTVKRHLEQYAIALAECSFILVDSSDEEFVIGDTPIIPASLGFGEAEAMMPICPNRAILVIRGWQPPLPDRAAIFRGQRLSVRTFNRTMVQNAEREVFCRTPPPLEFIRTHLGSRQVRLAPDLVGPSDVRTHLLGPMLDRPGA